MKNYLKYIGSMLLGNTGIAFAIFLPVIIICYSLNSKNITFNLCVLIYGLIYIFTYLLLVSEFRPYSDWIEADNIDKNEDELT